MSFQTEKKFCMFQSDSSNSIPVQLQKPYTESIFFGQKDIKNNQNNQQQQKRMMSPMQIQSENSQRKKQNSKRRNKKRTFEDQENSSIEIQKSKQIKKQKARINSANYRVRVKEKLEKLEKLKQEMRKQHQNQFKEKFKQQQIEKQLIEQKERNNQPEKKNLKLESQHRALMNTIKKLKELKAMSHKKWQKMISESEVQASELRKKVQVLQQQREQIDIQLIKIKQILEEQKQKVIKQRIMIKQEQLKRKQEASKEQQYVRNKYNINQRQRVLQGQQIKRQQRQIDFLKQKVSNYQRTYGIFRQNGYFYQYRQDAPIMNSQVKQFQQQLTRVIYQKFGDYLAFDLSQRGQHRQDILIRQFIKGQIIQNHDLWHILQQITRKIRLI